MIPVSYVTTIIITRRTRTLPQKKAAPYEQLQFIFKITMNFSFSSIHQIPHRLRL